MAEAVISLVVESLGNLLIEEAKFIHGVSDQVGDLHRELRWMQCFLKDADARQYEDHRVGIWVKEIKEIAYDAGDVLESFIIRVESTRGESIQNVLMRFMCFVNEAIVLHKFGLKISAIKTNIVDLSARLQTYGVRSLSEDRRSFTSIDQRRTYSHLDKDDFVGLKEDVEKLVEHLVTHDCKVVAICGLGGLGKTTLAKRIYQHEKVKDHFETHVWICISQEWQSTNILQEILAKLTPGAGLQQITFIKNEILVEFLKNALSVENMKGKVLLTSRNSKVVRQMTLNAIIHEPPTLTEVECFELLQKKIVTELNERDIEKKNLAIGMIRECGGLPLAVVVLGGILATKQSLVEWERVHRSIKSYIRRGEAMGQHEGGVSKILGLSYNDLPYQLKSCFLYLGQFKEDTNIETERLYHLWIAESMIMSEDQREDTMMDVAEGYLEELARRSMVQVQLAEEYSGVRRFEYCRLHDLMRDLSIHNGKEENFFHTYDIQHEKNQEHAESSSSSSSYLTNKTRRAVVCLNRNSTEFSLNKETCQSLRSLFLFITKDNAESVGLTRMLKSMRNDFKVLRVLHMEGIRFQIDHLPIMKAIGKLCHLRYFSVDCFVLELLSSIIKLKHLQTLYIQGTIEVCRPNSPNVLRIMNRLQHLYLPFYSERMHSKFKLQFDDLSKLETLHGFDSSWCGINSLYKLTNLQNIRAVLTKIEELDSIIEYLNSTAAKHMRHSEIWLLNYQNPGLEKICSISKETLQCGRLSKLIIRNIKCTRLPIFDEVQNFSQSLKELELFGMELEEDPMPTLEKLPKLQDL